MKVRCIRNSAFGYYSIGKVYEVIEIGIDGYYKINNKGYPWWCNPSSFILLKSNLLPKNVKIL
jgi:hypothetical protein